MLASTKWLNELTGLGASVEQLSARFTELGLEVEGIKAYGQLPGVVVAEVRGKRAHPQRENLSLVTLFDGSQEIEVVCGAPNVPVAGKRVLFAQLGAKLPNGMEISERKLAGVVSRGMICSEVELDIGADGDGILVLADDAVAKPGTSASQALDLEDHVLEIGLTPNRPDCLGHVGLARELCAALPGGTLKLPRGAEPSRTLRSEIPAGTKPVELFAGQMSDAMATPVALTVADPERCPRYAACVVQGVKVGPSPFWLRYRLHVMGLRSINNAVDITNLVLLEYGYPTHAFDLGLVRGGRIEVRTGRAGESLRSLDGVERQVGSDDLVICDAEGPLAVAGVMGGADSGIRETTQNVLVECAYFDPRGVRRTSRRLGLHTDSSHRFERGVDPQAVPRVLARVAALLSELCGGVPAASGFEVYPKSIAQPEITLRSARTEALLGVKLPAGKAQAVLSALGCQVSEGAAGQFKVVAPSHRPDLTREEDLIEEIARVWGYDKIPTEVPSIKASHDGTQPLTRFVRALKERAAAVGLTEAVNYAFVAPKQLERARVSTNAVRVANPLSEERSVMRTSLLPGLAANLLRAQRHQVASTTIFELARTFEPSQGDLPQERHMFGVILAGSRADWIGEEGTLDFFDGKGVLESIVRPLTRQSVDTLPDAEFVAAQAFLHPRRAARLVVGSRSVGLLGELHPDVVESLELSGPVVYAEIVVAELLAAREAGAPQVRGLPRFPASSRDIAIEVDEAVSAGSVAELLRRAGGKLLEQVRLFDLYRGGQLKAGKKSLAFRLTYRDAEATLTDQRVDEAHAKVVAEASKGFGGSLRT
ncbi:MAG: phenylalanine--tRNA ligase subunit beta [Myxococcales bacterium]